MTLLLYARRKEWPLEGVTVELVLDKVLAREYEERDEGDNTMIDLIRRNITLKGDLDQEQRERLMSISRRCPVHRLLTESPKILDEMNTAG